MAGCYRCCSCWPLDLAWWRWRKCCSWCARRAFPSCANRTQGSESLQHFAVLITLRCGPLLCRLRLYGGNFKLFFVFFKKLVVFCKFFFLLVLYFGFSSSWYGWTR